MNCHEAQPLMHDLLDRDLEASSRRALEQHLALCEACDHRYDEMLTVDRCAGDREPVGLPSDFTDRVMARVVSEARPAAAAAGRYRLAVLLGAVAAGAALAAILSQPQTAPALYSTAAGSITQTLISTGAELAAVGQEGVEAIGAALSTLEEYRSPLSPLWLLLSAALATALMVAFNYAHARAESRK